MKRMFTRDLISFPHPLMAGEDGVLDISDDLSVERLLEAYSFGIFPWPHDGYPTLWFSPAKRGVLDFADLHIPKSLRKFLRHSPFSVTRDCDFAAVIRECAQARDPTWITPKIIRAYENFHTADYAHSVEVWREGRLVGGLYGVYVAGVFSAESMFFRETNASKVALLHLIDFLGTQGLKWMDIQMVTSVLKQLGGREISREEFFIRLMNVRETASAIDFFQVRT